MSSCLWCSACPRDMHACGSCGARYCNEACQRSDWTHGAHVHLCTGPDPQHPEERRLVHTDSIVHEIIRDAHGRLGTVNATERTKWVSAEREPVQALVTFVRTPIQHAIGAPTDGKRESEEKTPSGKRGPAAMFDRTREDVLEWIASLRVIIDVTKDVLYDNNDASSYNSVRAGLVTLHDAVAEHEKTIGPEITQATFTAEMRPITNLMTEILALVSDYSTYQTRGGASTLREMIRKLLTLISEKIKTYDQYHLENYVRSDATTAPLLDALSKPGKEFFHVPRDIAMQIATLLVDINKVFARQIANFHRNVAEPSAWDELPAPVYQHLKRLVFNFSNKFKIAEIGRFSALRHLGLIGCIITMSAESGNFSTLHTLDLTDSSVKFVTDVDSDNVIVLPKNLRHLVLNAALLTLPSSDCVFPVSNLRSLDIVALHSGQFPVSGYMHIFSPAPVLTKLELSLGGYAADITDPESRYEISPFEKSTTALKKLALHDVRTSRISGTNARIAIDWIRGYATNLEKLSLHAASELTEDFPLGSLDRVLRKISQLRLHHILMTDDVLSMPNLTDLRLVAKALSAADFQRMTQLVSLQKLSISGVAWDVPTLHDPDVTERRRIRVPSLAGLYNLTTLHLNECDFYAYSASSLSSSSSRIRIESVSSSMPDWLVRMTHLQVLSMTNCGLADMYRAGNLVRLKSLNLSRNNISVMPQTLSTLTALVNLDMSANRIRTIDPILASLPSLRSINLAGNDTTDFDEAIEKGWEVQMTTPPAKIAISPDQPMLWT